MVAGGQLSAPVLRTGTWRVAFGRIALPAWFVSIDAVFQFLRFETLFVDSWVYQKATNIWLEGGDPWMLGYGAVPYVAAPWSLLPYVPTAWLPIELATWGWAFAGIASAVWIVRHLGLPLWWLAFPPLTMALWHGNAQPLVLAALLLRAPWGVALAGGIRLYGLVPAIIGRRWRELGIVAFVFGVTLPFLPWGLWVEHRFGFEAATTVTWNGSAWRFWPLMPFAAAAIWLLRKRGGEWLAVAALWPGTQFFYHVFALPALRDRPWLAAALALPMPLLAPLAVIAVALLEHRAGGRR